MYIREIKEKDNQEVENLIRFCLIEYGGNREGTAWTDPNLGRFSTIYGWEGCRYWVAVDEQDEIVAGVGIGPLEGVDGVCELQKMYAYPQVRGSGIAHQLMKIALEHAAKYYDCCYLETFENMIPAQKFYHKWNFVPVTEALGDTGHFGCPVRLIRKL